jgi:hypothetical protein
MLPPVDPKILEQNPNFATLYKDLCTRKLNADASTRDTKKQRIHEEIRRVRTIICLHLPWNSGFQDCMHQSPTHLLTLFKHLAYRHNPFSFVSYPLYSVYKISSKVVHFHSVESLASHFHLKLLSYIYTIQSSSVFPSPLYSPRSKQHQQTPLSNIHHPFSNDLL